MSSIGVVPACCAVSCVAAAACAPSSVCRLQFATAIHRFPYCCFPADGADAMEGDCDDGVGPALQSLADYEDWDAGAASASSFAGNRSRLRPNCIIQVHSVYMGMVAGAICVCTFRFIHVLMLNWQAFLPGAPLC